MANLAIIRSNVRRNLSDTNSAFFNDFELNQFIGEAYQYYTMIMIDEGQGYFETTMNLSFTAGNPFISLNFDVDFEKDFYTIVKVERWLSNGSSVPLKLNERRFKINSTIAIATGDAYQPTYNLKGRDLVIEPTPTSTETPAPHGQVNSGLLLWYNYVPDFPTAGSDDNFSFSREFPTLWTPMVELFATIRAMESKEGIGGVCDTQTFRTTLATWEQRFMDSLERDETPESVEQIGMDYSWNIYTSGFF